MMLLAGFMNILQGGCLPSPEGKSLSVTYLSEFPDGTFRLMYTELVEETTWPPLAIAICSFRFVEVTLNIVGRPRNDRFK